MDEQRNADPREPEGLTEPESRPEAVQKVSRVTPSCPSSAEESSDSVTAQDDNDSETAWGISIDLIKTENPQDSSRKTDADIDVEVHAGEYESDVDPQNDIRHFTRVVQEKLKELNSRVDDMACQLSALRNELNIKFTNHQRKDALIDSLHSELQQCKMDSRNKEMEDIVLEVIRIVDDIRKITGHYQEQRDLDSGKVLSILEDLPSELESLFVAHGLKSYSSPMMDFDPQRHKVLRRIETTETNLDKKIAASLRPGYTMGSRILRPEMVDVYVCSTDA